MSQFATSRPHLLLIEADAGAATRLRVERHAREQGWPVVTTPADADLLVVCGVSNELEQHLDRVWDQLPGPRAQVRLCGDDDVAAALRAARGRLIDPSVQQGDVRRTERPPAAPAPMADMDMGDMDMGGDMDTGDGGPHAGHDMGDMDMGDMGTGDGGPHAGHDMGDMDMGDMQMPAGLGMADRAPDRDGLMLDVLTVPWGPVLPWWPTGLILTTVLQGDVVQSATAKRLGSDSARRTAWAVAVAHLEPAHAAAVVRLDALVRLLGVAGWDTARLRCQRVRDALLTGEQDVRGLHRLARQVSRSTALGRMTTGIPTTGGDDVAARYRRWLDEAVAAVDSGALPPPVDGPHALQQLADAVTGMEVAGMRLVVASLDLTLSGADARTAAHG